VGVSQVCILGYNVNKGQEISLRLRTDDYAGFRKYLAIRKTLVHELTHNVSRLGAGMLRPDSQTACPSRDGGGMACNLCIMQLDAAMPRFLQMQIYVVRAWNAADVSAT
jgi:hypothetical protein